MHVEADLLHGICNVRSRQSEILEHLGKALVVFAVRHEITSQEQSLGRVSTSVVDGLQYVTPVH